MPLYTRDSERLRSLTGTHLHAGKECEQMYEGTCEKNVWEENVTGRAAGN